MWVIVHAMSGMALGAVLGSAGVGFPLWGILLASLAAHALLDIVPHWDYTRRRHAWAWALGDTLAAALALGLAWLILDLPGYVVWAGLISAAPDLDVLDAVLPFKKHRRLFPSHWKPYPHGKTGSLPGTVIQGLVVTGSVVVLLLAL